MNKLFRQIGLMLILLVSTYTYGNVRLYARCFLVDGHVNFQTIIQSVDTRFQRKGMKKTHIFAVINLISQLMNKLFRQIGLMLILLTVM